MDKFRERPANTDLYARIKLAPMTAIEREVALNALRDAEVIVNAIVWVMNGTRQLFAKVLGKPAGLKPGFKH